MTILRPGDAALHITIGVPLEESAPTADEPPGTRSFQFFAVCREPFPAQELPPWIDVADLDAAQAANPEILTPDASLILPTSSWAGCVLPITPRDPRMPISCEGTAPGIEVAADALPPGNHVLYGYTYEPAKNVWTPRVGLLRVVGEAGDDVLPPAVAFTYPVSDSVASTGRGVTLTGCATGNAGTTIEFSWATASNLIAFGDEAWEPFDSLAIADADTFSVPFVPPPGTDYKVVKFRGLATDPAGGQWAAYTRQPMVLEPGCAQPQGGTELVADVCAAGSGAAEPTDAGAGQVALEVCAPGEDSGPDSDTSDSGDGDGDESDGDESDGDESDSGGATGSADSSSGDPAGQGEGFSGCGCAAPASPAPCWLVSLAVVALARRRRRLGLTRPCSQRPRWRPARPSATRPR
ncbi:MAG: hypothetical protein JKY37_13545 [Nannocystaceae bacterium]|nr:hypothetical protein [Nannocystaceae bacterium]